MGPKGILNHVDQLRSWLFIDSSTIDPQTSRKLSAAISISNLKGKKGNLILEFLRRYKHLSN